MCPRHRGAWGAVGCWVGCVPHHVPLLCVYLYTANVYVYRWGGAVVLKPCSQGDARLLSCHWRCPCGLGPALEPSVPPARPSGAAIPSSSRPAVSAGGPRSHRGPWCPIHMLGTCPADAGQAVTPGRAVTCWHVGLRGCGMCRVNQCRQLIVAAGAGELLAVPGRRNRADIISPPHCSWRGWLGTGHHAAMGVGKTPSGLSPSPGCPGSSLGQSFGLSTH